MLKTCTLHSAPAVLGYASIAGAKEIAGPHGAYIDMAAADDTMGQDSYEQAECQLVQRAVRCALQKAALADTQVDCMLGGDLLNQIISSNFAARELGFPFLGLYGACSTMVESLLVGAMMVAGGFAKCVVCTAASHYSTAERQYRQPLEMGVQRTPTQQRTVTGAGATVLGQQGTVRLTRFTVGRVVDLGITDANNMGAAMAPAACDTLVRHFRETGLSPDYYDAIYTGDLGIFGHKLLRDLLLQEGIDPGPRLHDCGCEIFAPKEDVQCGGSGCGCAAVVLNGYLLRALHERKLRRILLAATGALLSPTSTMQGESIPGISHAVALEVE